MKYFENYQNVTQRQEVRKCCWKNDANRLAPHRVATNLQFVKKKKTVFLKCNKTRYALSCRKRKYKVLVAQLYLTLCDPMVYPWDSLGKNTGVVAIPFSRGSF